MKKDAPAKTKLVAPELPPRVILDLATRCNLRCNMCPVWGATEQETDQVAGVMSLENARKILDEVMAAKPLLHPALYGEPTLAPTFEAVIKEAKDRGMTIAINTNGLTMNDDMAVFAIEHLDSISVSIDAVTPETLKKIRGIEKLDKIEAAVHRPAEGPGREDAAADRGFLYDPGRQSARTRRLCREMDPGRRRRAHRQPVQGRLSSRASRCRRNAPRVAPSTSRCPCITTGR